MLISRMIERNIKMVGNVIKDLAMPILVGLVLYGTFEENVVRYLLSAAVILTCFQFMAVSNSSI